MKKTILNTVTVILFAILFALAYATHVAPSLNLYLAMFYDIAGIAMCCHLYAPTYYIVEVEED